MMDIGQGASRKGNRVETDQYKHKDSQCPCRERR